MNGDPDVAKADQYVRDLHDQIARLEDEGKEDEARALVPKLERAIRYAMLLGLMKQPS